MMNKPFLHQLYFYCKRRVKMEVVDNEYCPSITLQSSFSFYSFLSMPHVKEITIKIDIS